MDKDRLVASVVGALEDADPEKVSKALNPIILTFAGVGLIKRSLRKSTGISLSYKRVYHSVMVVSWLSWFVSRNVTSGYLHTVDAHRAAREGLKKS